MSNNGIFFGFISSSGRCIFAYTSKGGFIFCRRRFWSFIARVRDIGGVMRFGFFFSTVIPGGLFVDHVHGVGLFE